MRRSFLLLLASMLFFSSCVKDYYLDAGERPKVVVECVLTEEPVQELYLSYTKGVSQEEVEPLLEAEVRLIDLDAYNASFYFARFNEGKWVLDYTPYPRHKYRLEIKVPGHDLITAETTMPEICSVKQAFCDPLAYYQGSWTPYERIEEIEGYGYSGGSFYYNIPDRCWIFFRNEDGTMAETICTNYPGVDNFNLIGDKYYSDSLKRTKHAIYTYEPFPWEEEEQVDVFLYPVLIGEGLHDRFLRIPKGKRASWTIPTSIPGINGPNPSFYYKYKESIVQFANTFIISGSFIVDRPVGYLYFQVLSEEYDKYLVAAFNGVKLDNSTDISKIYLRDNIIESNIKGGLGIFGAKTEKKIEWVKFYSSIESPVMSPAPWF